MIPPMTDMSYPKSQKAQVAWRYISPLSANLESHKEDKPTYNSQRVEAADR